MVEPGNANISPTFSRNKNSQNGQTGSTYKISLRLPNKNKNKLACEISTKSYPKKK